MRAYFLVALWGIMLGLTACDNKSGVQNIANIGDEKVTEADFEAYLRLKRIPNAPGDRRERARKTFLERNALARAIAQEPVLEKTEIEAELRDFRNELLISRYFEQFLSKQITDEAVRAYYDQNVDTFRQRKARVAHILFRVRPGMNEPAKSAKFAKALEVYNKIKSGAAFSELASQLSEDPLSARQGGDLGWRFEAQMERAFADAVFALAPGAVSEPVNTARGYHLIKLLEVQVANQRSFEEVQGEIRYRLRYEAKLAEMKRLQSRVK